MKEEIKITEIKISWIIVTILSWFLFDWQIALIITFLLADIKYKPNK